MDSTKVAVKEKNKTKHGDQKMARFFFFLRIKCLDFFQSMIPGIGMQAPTVQQHLHVEEASQGHFYEQTNGPLRHAYFLRANKQESSVS